MEEVDVQGLRAHLIAEPAGCVGECRGAIRCGAELRVVWMAGRSHDFGGSLHASDAWHSLWGSGGVGLGSELYGGAERPAQEQAARGFNILALPSWVGSGSLFNLPERLGFFSCKTCSTRLYLPRF